MVFVTAQHMISVNDQQKSLKSFPNDNKTNYSFPKKFMIIFCNAACVEKLRYNWLEVS